MVMVVMVLVVLTGACKKADVDPIEPDDIQFVKAEVRVVGYEVLSDIIVGVRASTATQVSASGKFSDNERVGTFPVGPTNGQWVNINLSGLCTYLEGTPGHYELVVTATLASTGKTISKSIPIIVGP